MLKILQEGCETEVFIGEGALQEKAALLRDLGRRLAVVTDQRVERLFKADLEELGLPFEFFSFPAGEKHKTRKTKERLEDALLKARFGRDGALVALGGGVVSDMAGFVAATFCRGVPLVLIPTTLLAMVDASLGGKTAVNTKQGKNLIGAFYPAKLVLMDTRMLATLGKEEMRSGMAEVIKYGMIADPKLLELSDLNEIIRHSVLVKKGVIERDFQERGERRTLNFGHTVGHALELIEKFKILHGDAVAIGMLIESLMSALMGFLKEERVLLLLSILKKHGFPLRLSAKVTQGALENAMRTDKKSLNGAAQFVVLEEIGKVHAFGGMFTAPFSSEILAKALKKYEELTR